MNIRHLLPLAALCAASTLHADEPAHLANGLLLVDQIRAAQANHLFTDSDGVEINRYGGSWNSNDDPSYIRFLDVEHGVYPGNNTTCAPLVTHLLKYSYNWNWSAYTFIDPLTNKSTKSASPNPPRYNALIKQRKGFTAQITHVLDAQPGDVISMHKLGTSSGHTVLFVALDTDHPLAYPASGSNWNPALAGTTFYRLTVLDSTSSPHSNDTREFTLVDENDVATPYEITGIGTGDMGILVNPDGTVVGHTWSLPNSDYDQSPGGWMGGINSRLYLQNDRELVIGRLPAMP